MKKLDIVTFKKGQEKVGNFVIVKSPYWVTYEKYHKRLSIKYQHLTTEKSKYHTFKKDDIGYFVFGENKLAKEYYKEINELKKWAKKDKIKLLDKFPVLRISKDNPPYKSKVVDIKHIKTGEIVTEIATKYLKIVK